MNGEKKKLKMAVIGAGGMGTRWAEAIRSHARAELSLVIDTDIAKAKNLAERLGARAADSFDARESAPDIDAAVVALPHRFLAPAAARALQRGMHVLVEKPGAINSEEMKKAADLAWEKNLRLMVAYNHRFHQGMRELRRLADSGFLGGIMFIRAVYGFGGRKEYGKEWRHQKEMSGGGELIDQGVHLIDAARWFLGDIADARGLTQNAFWKSGVEDNAFMLLKNKEGKIASLHASWSQWDPRFVFEIYGDRGYARMQGLGKKYGGVERVFYAARRDDFSLPREEMIECDTDADNSLRRALDEFVSAIAEERDPRPGGEDALAVLKIVEDLYRNTAA
ncbi:MAG: Gfo/Idh/MocA family oxidoreductase [Patescibacteria group bacterium]